MPLFLHCLGLCSIIEHDLHFVFLQQKDGRFESLPKIYLLNLPMPQSGEMVNINLYYHWFHSDLRRCQEKFFKDILCDPKYIYNSLWPHLSWVWRGFLPGSDWEQLPSSNRQNPWHRTITKTTAEPTSLEPFPLGRRKQQLADRLLIINYSCQTWEPLSLFMTLIPKNVISTKVLQVGCPKTKSWFTRLVQSKFLFWRVRFPDYV